MIRTYLTFELADGAASDFIRAFKEERILEFSTTDPGCMSAELTISPDHLTAIVTAAWADTAAYRRWTSRTDRGEHAANLNRFLKRPIEASTTGSIFEIAHASGWDFRKRRATRHGEGGVSDE